jgi:hypothetical protein
MRIREMRRCAEALYISLKPRKCWDSNPDMSLEKASGKPFFGFWKTRGKGEQETVNWRHNGLVCYSFSSIPFCGVPVDVRCSSAYRCEIQKSKGLEVVLNLDDRRRTKECGFLLLV